VCEGFYLVKMVVLNALDDFYLAITFLITGALDSYGYGH